MSRTSKNKRGNSGKKFRPEIPDRREPCEHQLVSKRIQFLLSFMLVAVFGAFYFSQDLFQVNNLNDFGEYMLRAQDWAGGTFSMAGGSDILLSVLEFLALKSHPNDFLSFYSLTSALLTCCILVASFVFLVRTNPLLPDFWIRLGTTAVFLSIPHFVFATRTVDQSLLFGACLLLFIATYDLPWAGFVGVLTWFSRPEAVIVLPLFGLMYLVHRDRRREILFNFGGFLLLMLIVSLAATFANSTVAPAEYQQYSFLSKIDFSWFVRLCKHLVNIPGVIMVYAMEAIQNLVLLLVFAVGLIFSLRERSAVLMYGVLITFCIAYAVFFADAEPETYKSYYAIIRRMGAERDYFVVNAFNKFDASIGHGRYRLVLYPAIAFFMVSGVAQIFRKVIQHKVLQRRSAYAITLFAGMTSLYFVAGRYPSIADSYQSVVQMQRLPSMMKVAMALRPHVSSTTRLYIDGLCDNSRGSFMSDFAVFSGIREFVVRVCPGTEFWQDGPDPIASEANYTREHPFNSQAIMLFHDASVRRSEISDPAFCQRLIEATSTLQLESLSRAGINLIVSPRELNLQHLRQLGTIDNVRYFTVD